MRLPKTPKGKTERILKVLEDNGYHPIDVSYGNGYFIFDHGKDMVIHFHIKELKGWKFGIWWNLEDNNKFDFFTQFERDIDKFKPEASALVVKDREFDATYEAEVGFYIIPILRFIKNHRYVAWCYETYQPEPWDYMSEWTARKLYYKYAWKYYYRIPRITKRMYNKWLDIANQICSMTLENYEIVDWNKDGSICFPRYSILCDGFAGENQKQGFYSMDLKAEVNDKLVKKAEKYDEKLKKYQKKGIYLDCERFDGSLDYAVRKKKNDKSRS